MRIIDKTCFEDTLEHLKAGTIFSDPEDGRIWMRAEDSDLEECYCVRLEDGVILPFSKKYCVNPRHGELTIWSEAKE